MNYFVTFLEGIITFVSPCMLPMLPLYISYFGGGSRDADRKATLRNTLGFVLGFTLVFVLMGAFAAGIGSFLREHQNVLNIILGTVMIVLGLSYMGLFQLPIFQGGKILSKGPKVFSFWPSVLFGMIFSIGWTPCVGAFLGSALMLAASAGHGLQGVLLLLCFSVGLGLPFILSAVLLDRVKGTFEWIKRNYRTINIVCGAFLVLVGITMVTGWFQALLSMLSI
ncbi:MAG: cytochrome c biogenesis CcdA family protein [Christensenellales bacterium]|jgi:cytochrome c-type biogenesis protein